jgi:hypothetical protein
VRADPKPIDRVLFEKAKGTPTPADPDGVDGIFRVDSLEMETGVGRILLPELIVLPSPSLDLSR